MTADAVVKLDPWDGYARPFTVTVDGTTVVDETLSHGQWTVSGKVHIHWAGWYNPAHQHLGGHEYDVDTSNCVAGETLHIGYVPYPGKRDSVTVTCALAPVPPVSTPVTSPPVPPVTTADLVPDSPVAPPSPPVTPPDVTTPGIELHGVPTTTLIPITSLPFTGGSADVTGLIAATVLIAGITLRIGGFLQGRKINQ